MIKVMHGVSCPKDAFFDEVHEFEFASLRTLYTFVKEYAIAVAKEIQEHSMGHAFPVVEMIEDSNGLPTAEIWQDNKIVDTVFCDTDDEYWEKVNAV